eukprot:SAG31_NODE_12592_length_931_cov_0.822115_2_plen_30_part_01
MKKEKLLLEATGGDSLLFAYAFYTIDILFT